MTGEADGMNQGVYYRDTEINKQSVIFNEEMVGW